MRTLSKVVGGLGGRAGIAAGAALWLVGGPRLFLSGMYEMPGGDPVEAYGSMTSLLAFIGLATLGAAVLAGAFKRRRAVRVLAGLALVVSAPTVFVPQTVSMATVGMSFFEVSLGIAAAATVLLGATGVGRARVALVLGGTALGVFALGHVGGGFASSNPLLAELLSLAFGGGYLAVALRGGETAAASPAGSEIATAEAIAGTSDGPLVIRVDPIRPGV